MGQWDALSVASIAKTASASFGHGITSGDRLPTDCTEVHRRWMRRSEDSVHGDKVRPPAKDLIATFFL
jgi:hypothetical protein